MGSLKLFIADLLVKTFSNLMPPKLMKDKRYFQVWERKGYHITPNHFYEHVPNISTLREDLWNKHSELPGIEMNESKQLALLSEFADKFKNEYDQLPLDETLIKQPYEYYIKNTSFTEVDGEIFYCIIRHFKPRRIFEIGAGFSTYLAAHALMKNNETDGIEAELVSFEPYPNEVLKKGFPGFSRLVAKGVERIGVSDFTELVENDVLFIDSSHVLKIGSDVQYEYLEILPRLNKGVIIHAHDIFLPAEYLKDWVLKDYRFWTEQYLLQSFLSFNDSFEVLWAGSYMHLRHSEKLVAAFRSYNRIKSWPASFWIRKTK